MQFSIVLFTRTEEYHHESILDGVRALQRLGKKHYFEVTWHEKANIATPEILNYDAIVFLNTSGAALLDEEKEFLQEMLNMGKGFIGIHAAAATEQEWEWYTKLIGRKFIGHPPVQTASLRLVDDNFPGLGQIKDPWLWTDEWYVFGPELKEDLQYILRVDEDSYDPVFSMNEKKYQGMGTFHPVSWFHHYDGGRSFYTALGHLGESYQDHFFLEHLYGGIYWAATGKGINNH